MEPVRVVFDCLAAPAIEKRIEYGLRRSLVTRLVESKKMNNSGIEPRRCTA